MEIKYKQYTVTLINKCTVRKSDMNRGTRLYRISKDIKPLDRVRDVHPLYGLSNDVLNNNRFM